MEHQFGAAVHNRGDETAMRSARGGGAAGAASRARAGPEGAQIPPMKIEVRACHQRLKEF